MGKYDDLIGSIKMEVSVTEVLDEQAASKVDKQLKKQREKFSEPIKPKLDLSDVQKQLGTVEGRMAALEKEEKRLGTQLSDAISSGDEKAILRIAKEHEKVNEQLDQEIEKRKEINSQVRAYKNELKSNRGKNKKLSAEEKFANELIEKSKTARPKKPKAKASESGGAAAAKEEAKANEQLTESVEKVVKAKNKSRSVKPKVDEVEVVKKQVKANEDLADSYKKVEKASKSAKDAYLASKKVYQVVGGELPNTGKGSILYPNRELAEKHANNTNGLLGAGTVQVVEKAYSELGEEAREAFEKAFYSEPENKKVVNRNIPLSAKDIDTYLALIEGREDFDNQYKRLSAARSKGAGSANIKLSYIIRDSLEMILEEDQYILDDEVELLERILQRRRSNEDLLKEYMSAPKVEHTPIIESADKQIEKNKELAESYEQVGKAAQEAGEKEQKSTKIKKSELLENIEVLEDKDSMYDAKTVAQKRKAAEGLLREQWQFYQEMKKEYDDPENATHIYDTDYDGLLQQGKRLEAYIALYEKYGGSVEKVSKKLKAFSDDQGFTGAYQYAIDEYMPNAIQILDELSQDPWNIKDEKEINRIYEQRLDIINQIGEDRLKAYNTDLYEGIMDVNNSYQNRIDAFHEYRDLKIYDEIDEKYGYNNQVISSAAELEALLENRKNLMKDIHLIEDDSYKTEQAYNQEIEQRISIMKELEPLVQSGAISKDTLEDMVLERGTLDERREMLSGVWQDVFNLDDGDLDEAQMLLDQYEKILVTTASGKKLELGPDMTEADYKAFMKMDAEKAKSIEFVRKQIETQTDALEANTNVAKKNADVHEKANKKKEKAFNMDSAIKRYNKLMNEIAREHLTIGTKFSEDTDGWNIRDMVSEAQAQLNTYYEDGHSNAMMRDGDPDERKAWKSETGKIKRFIDAFEPFIDGLNTTVNHLSKYDNTMRPKDYATSQLSALADKAKSTDDTVELSKILEARRQIIDISEDEVLFDQQTLQAERAINEEIRTRINLQRQASDIVYHAGDLSDINNTLKSFRLGNVSPSESEMAFNGLTGLYTTEDVDGFWANEWDGAPISTIDLSHYKMFDAKNDELATKARTFFDNLNGAIYGYIEYFDHDSGEMKKNLDVKSVEDLYSDFKEVFKGIDLDLESFANFIKHSKSIVAGNKGFIDIELPAIDEGIAKSAQGTALQGVSQSVFNADSFQTQLLKMLGFEGVDLRGTKFNGTYTGGTVVFDIKPESVKATNEKWSDVMARNGYEIDDAALAREEKRRELAFETAKAYSKQAEENERVAEIAKQTQEFTGNMQQFTPEQGWEPELELTKKYVELLDQVTNGLLTADEAMERFKESLTSVEKSQSDFNDEMRETSNLGYHAGDLGKAESYGQFAYGKRDTGHFGTGTYFVGDPKQIEGYNSRNGIPAPIEQVDFSKYNLFTPKDTEEAYDLHSALKMINDDLKYMHQYDDIDLGSLIQSYEDGNKAYVLDFLNKYLTEQARDHYEAEALAHKDYLENLDESKIREEVTKDYSKITSDLLDFGELPDDWLIEEDLIEDAVKERLEDRNKALQNFDLDTEMAKRVAYDIEHDKFDDVSEMQELKGVLVDKLSKIITGKTKEEISDALEETFKTISGYSEGEFYKVDNASTTFMKQLGYEGIDVRHTDLDNTGYGSVIYDLKGEDLARRQEILEVEKQITAEQKEQVQTESTQWIDDIRARADALGQEFRESKQYDDFFDGIEEGSTTAANAIEELNKAFDTFNIEKSFGGKKDQNDILLDKFNTEISSKQLIKAFDVAKLGDYFNSLHITDEGTIKYLKDLYTQLIKLAFAIDDNIDVEDKFAATYDEIISTLVKFGYVVHDTGDVYDDFLGFMKDTKVTWNKGQRAEFGDNWSSVRKDFGKYLISLSSGKGIGVDQIWDELQRFGLFSELDGANEHSMLVALIRELNNAKTKRENAVSREEIESKLSDQYTNMVDAVTAKDSAESIKSESDAMEEVAEKAESASKAKDKFTRSNRKVGKETQSSTDDIKEEADAMEELADASTDAANAAGKVSEEWDVISSNGAKSRSRLSEESNRVLNKTRERLIHDKDSGIDIPIRVNTKDYSLLEKDIQRHVRALDRTINKNINESGGINVFNDKFKADYKEYLRLLGEMREAQKNITSGNGTAEDFKKFDEAADKANKLKVSLEGVFKEQQKASKFGDAFKTGVADPTDVDKLKVSMLELASAATDGKFELKGFNDAGTEMYGVMRTGANTVEEITVALKAGTNQIIAYRGATKTVTDEFEKFKSSIGKSAAQIAGMYIGFQDFVRYASQGVQSVREIDLAMTELRKVTDETEETYARFLDTASQTAGSIGSTVKDFTTVTSDFARLGYNISEAAEMAKTALIYENVGDGFSSVEEASQSIISTMKAFGIEAEDTMGIVDRFNEVNFTCLLVW